MSVKKEIIEQMNSFGQKGKEFSFLIDFEEEDVRFFKVSNQNEILWKTPTFSNYEKQKVNTKIKQWKIKPVSFQQYEKGFKLIQKHICNGDTYLLNYTQPTLIETNLSLDEIFHLSNAPYKILLKNKFACFSPERFIEIRDGRISSFPMKGTIDATLPNAKELILRNTKELAEHHTIVDLIRNDLSLVAEEVTVENFRYLERIKTNTSDLWQVSSKISGVLPKDYTSLIGDIIFKMLPAGSICGAPKKKTVEITKAAESYKRGFYTGIFGYFDGKNLDSCILIRYVEKQNNQLVYKSGGGITFMSKAEKEYEELLSKVYIPIDT